MAAERKIIWTPQPKQRLFLERNEFEAFYGGAAGGGKSDAMVVEALRQVNIPHYKGIILRKTYPQLAELIDKSYRYYKAVCPKARYNSSEHTWKFPSGAKIIFGSMQHSQDKIKYQGQAYDFVGFDELTHFTYDEYIYMFSRCRPNGPGTQLYVRATGNPGGIGHGWVKQRFIDAGPPMKTIWALNEWDDPDGNHHKAKQSRIFVPSSVFDNPALLQNDPMYIQRLASLPKADRDALLMGDWNSFSGQVFNEWRDKEEHYKDRKWTHVIDPFRVPDSWSIWCGLDWGYSKPFSVGWYAVDTNRRIYRIRELYGSNGEPNVGTQWEPDRVAEKMKEIEANDVNLRGKRINRVGDPAIWGTQGKESIGTLFEKQRIYWQKGNHERLSGKMQFHHRLRFNEDGIPMFYCFSTCRNFIRTVPNLVYSMTDVEDIDTDGEDHIYDETRYVFMESPIAAPVKEQQIIKPYDPLSTDDDDYDEYNYYVNYTRK